MDGWSHIGGNNCVRSLFCVAGWCLAALLACRVLPRVYDRLVVRVSWVQQAHWARLIENRKDRIAAVTWQDTRPLNILAGDSHIEMGHWYELFDGACAVRNCGLSGATIQDVSALVAAVPDRSPETVVLMCGINNIGRGDSVQSCVENYQKLLLAIHSSLKPRSIVVLSVMPVRQSPVDEKSRRMNDEVLAFNASLKPLCSERDEIFVDVNTAVTNASGGLASELTIDGLHLNQEGYKAIAKIIRNFLATEKGMQR
ncbi:MAG TPA: GDSL-type esterase/lipase family protein [Verrucomicrobiae bacterium]|nr:GDSL-type esterase/lipase family protein [Verrucomicrobiae bacterium]